MSFNPLSWFSRSTPSPGSPSPSSPSPSSTPSPSPSSSSSSSSPTTSSSLSPPPTTTPPPIPESVRLRKQLTTLIGGGTFLLLSIAVTRRSLAKRRLTLIPPYYHPNNRPPLIPPNGAIDAFEALNLATLNTVAFAMLLVGGGMFSLDVCNLQELRNRVQSSTDWGETQKAAEEEFEEWVVGVLARKELKEEVKRRVEKEVKGQ